MSIRSVRFACCRRRPSDSVREQSYSLLVRVLAVIACTALVAAAFATSLAVFWRASNTPTVLDALFSSWSDEMLILLGGGLLLAAIGAVHLVRRVLK